MPALRPLALLCLLPALLPAQERLTPELLWELRRVSDPQPSPDGKWVLYAVRTHDLQANSGRSQIYVMEIATRQSQKLTEAGSNWSARWAPDGAQRIAFVSTRSGSPQIHTMDLETRAVRQITSHTGGVANISWSPDGRHFAFTAEVQLGQTMKQRHPDLPLAKARIYDDLMVRHWDTWKEGSYSHLFVIPTKGGEARDLMQGMKVDTPLKPFGGGEQIDWSPDGKELCYTAKVVAAPEESTDSSLFTVPVGGGAHKNLTPGRPGYDTEPRYSPDGKYIAFASMTRAGFEADKNRLMLLDRQTGKIRDLTAAADLSVHEHIWAATGLFFTADIQGTRQICHVDLEGGVVQYTKGRYHFGSPRPHPSGGVVSTRMQMERPNEIVRVFTGSVTGELLNAPSYGGWMLTDENGAHFHSLDLPTTKARSFTATDNKQIHSWVIYPPGFDPKKKYPMLLYCQGGPQSQVGQWFSYRWNFHLMAAQGYVVLAVNRRGLPGFGQDWNDQISRDWGGQCMQDLLTATDVMRKEPYIDADRVGAVGASFGGYTVYWLMGNDKQDRFKAMIAHCGVFHLESMYLSTEELFFVNWDLGGPYWRSPEVGADYRRFSPHSFIGNWKCPLLVIHGQKDYRVPLEQGLQAFTAAQVQGVPSRFLYFPEENHWVLSPQNGVLWQREFFRWLKEHLR